MATSLNSKKALYAVKDQITAHRRSYHRKEMVAIYGRVPTDFNLLLDPPFTDCRDCTRLEKTFVAAREEAGI